MALDRKVILAVVAALAVVILAGAGIFSWLYFGTTRPTNATTVASAAAENYAEDIERITVQNPNGALTVLQMAVNATVERNERDATIVVKDAENRFTVNTTASKTTVTVACGHATATVFAESGTVRLRNSTGSWLVDAKNATKIAARIRPDLNDSATVAVGHNNITIKSARVTVHISRNRSKHNTPLLKLARLGPNNETMSISTVANTTVYEYRKSGEVLIVSDDKKGNRAQTKISPTSLSVTVNSGDGDSLYFALNATVRVARDGVQFVALPFGERYAQISYGNATITVATSNASAKFENVTVVRGGERLSVNASDGSALLRNERGTLSAAAARYVTVNTPDGILTADLQSGTFEMADASSFDLPDWNDVRAQIASAPAAGFHLAKADGRIQQIFTPVGALLAWIEKGIFDTVRTRRFALLSALVQLAHSSADEGVYARVAGGHLLVDARGAVFACGGVADDAVLAPGAPDALFAEAERGGALSANRSLCALQMDDAERKFRAFAGPYRVEATSAASADVVGPWGALAFRPARGA